MDSLRHATLLTVVVVFPLFLLSCASRPKPSLEVHQILAEPRSLFEAGEYQKAIAAYDTAFRLQPRLEGLLAAYVDSLEKIKLEADHSYRRKDFRAAERLYQLLLENFPLFEDFKMSLSFSQSGLREIIKSCRVQLAHLQAEEALQTNDFAQALGSLKALVETYPRDPEALAEYVQMSVEIEKRARLALSKENYALAGRAFFILSQNMGHLENLALALPFSRLSLEDGIKTCRLHLTRKGLEQYRKGKLEEAISIWKDLLAFDPANLEIQKAIETATEQLKKLKKN